MFRNAASQSFALFAFDITTGSPKTGDAANMVFYITKDWGSVTAIASNSGVPTEMDSTNAKGWYKIAVSQTESTANAIVFSGKSSTANVSVVGQLIQTVPPNFGITSIDGSGNVAANATQFAGQTITAAAGVTIPSSIASPTNITAGTITTVTNLTNAATAGDFTAAMKTSLNAATPASVTGAVGSVTGNVSGNVTGSVGSVVGLTAANLDVAVSTRLASASYTTPPTTAAITTAILTTQMTESYPALHTAPTLAQSLFETRALLAEKSVAGTTMTVNKVDGSTQAESYTLNDAVAPTAITRAS